MSETSTQAIEVTKEQIIEACKSVYDPEIPVDIYELGLIYDIKIFPLNNVYVQMTLTSPACPSAGELPGEVERAIQAIPHINDVQLELTFDPPYTQEMMSEIAKLELGFL
jgi:FeS assembly SUF system protein